MVVGKPDNKGTQHFLWFRKLQLVSMLVCFCQKQTGDTATESETSSSSGGEAQEVKSEVSQSTTKQETAEDDIEVLLQEKDEKIKQLQVRSLSHFMSALGIIMQPFALLTLGAHAQRGLQ